jgi:5'-3' exoribonuclease 1
MARLCEQLRYYVARRVSDDPAWRQLRVVLSGPDAPGEGEHKIMAYIRWSRAQPGYRPTTTHCLHGADADLLMLALLSHEPHFCVLREVFQRGGPQLRRAPSLDQFAIVHLSILRDYLALELAPLAHAPALQPAFSWERVYNDLVALTFLVGNDFLPNAPALYIPHGALDVLWELYGRVLPSLGDFLTAPDGAVHWNRLGAFLRRLADHERALCFEGITADVRWMRTYLAKAGGGAASAAAPTMPAAKETKALVPATPAPASALSTTQQRLVRLLKAFAYGTSRSLRLPTVDAADRAFLAGLVDELGMELQEAVRRNACVGWAAPGH